MQQEQKQDTGKGGYFTVHVGEGAQKVPYIIFATSDYHAARLVRHQTGYMAAEHEVEGPYQR